MSKLNPKNKADPVYTHGGARGIPVSVEQQLRRSVLSCLLFENEFYEEGLEISKRITALASQVKPEKLAALAIEARTNGNLRHVPLLLLNVLTKTGSGSSLVSQTIASVINRADELTDFLSLYWSSGKHPLSAQTKKGLALAISKFDEYQLAKYDRGGAVKLRDVLRLVHPNPHKDVLLNQSQQTNGESRADLYGRLLKDELKTPDTWEVALSGGADKKETFTRLLEEKKLGYMALLRNLRNMQQAGVDRKLIVSAILERRGARNVLPFRYFSAAREAPSFESALDEAMIKGFEDIPKLRGKTLVVLDVSGSMQHQLSSRGNETRLTAGAALAAVIRGTCEDVVMYATAGSDGLRKHKTQEYPARQGMALRDLLVRSMNDLGGGGIFLTPVMEFLEEKEKTAERIIVITDEQDCAVADKDRPSLASPFGRTGNYLINVASARNGVGYGKWTHIDGFSESVVRFIHDYENSQGLAE